MARKAIGTNQVQAEEKVSVKTLQNRLKKLIPAYGANNTQLKELKSVVDGDNKEIKALCKQLSIEKTEIDGWKVDYKVVEKHNANEDQMLEIIKKWWLAKNGSMHCPYIRIEYHVDNDAIEDGIYKGEFDKETLLALKACYTVKQEERLTVSKIKKED